MIDWPQLVSGAEREGLNWDFYEGSPTADQDCWRTVPGRIVKVLRDDGGSDRSIGLLAAYAARQSLACWFAYCESAEPLRRIDAVIDYWFSSRPEEQIAAYVEPCTPTIDGQEILDCRREDTWSASSSVANAAKFALAREDFYAITAICHAYIAFDVTPVTSVVTFRNWLLEFAIPAAVGEARMTVEMFEASAVTKKKTTGDDADVRDN